MMNHRSLFLPAAVVVGILVVGWLADRRRPHPAHENPADITSADERPASLPLDTIASLIEVDSPSSSHPVESAVADGVVLDSKLEPSGEPGLWMRTRLVKSKIQPRLVRVVERWRIDPDARKSDCLCREMFLADQLIVRSAVGNDEARLNWELGSAGMRIDSKIADGLFTVRLEKSDLAAMPEALSFLAAHPELALSAEPDGVGFGGGIPNDPSFSSQWGHHNTGQSGGSADADVDAPELWDIIGGTPGMVVAVLDSGLNFTHPDLQNIAWTNPGEISGDGIDNDSNGKTDDVRGWDFTNNDNNPTDDHGHGSNVTGIIAANRDNGVGIAGMLSGVKILTCKILNSSNSGLTSNLIAATNYARLRGVSVMNLSLQNYPFDTALNNEFTACQTAGIVLCICAGNQGVNNDTSPNYPSSHTQSNIISIGNHDRTDARWSGSFNPSNYGSVSVDIFAPGRDILSPVLGTAYSSYTGTSQATPYVTAVCAAIKYSNPTWTATEIKSCVLGAVVTRASYSGLCTTGGRLNAVDSISRAFRQLPTQDADGDRFSNFFEYLAGTLTDVASSSPLVSSGVTGGYLRIGVGRVTRADGHFEIETSTDLSLWKTSGITDFSTPTNLLGGIPTSSASKGFLRIKAVPSP